jgi:septal ring factor EnvC (AmiA/AmiB activator)
MNPNTKIKELQVEIAEKDDLVRSLTFQLKQLKVSIGASEEQILQLTTDRDYWKNQAINAVQEKDFEKIVKNSEIYKDLVLQFEALKELQQKKALKISKDECQNCINLQVEVNKLKKEISQLNTGSKEIPECKISYFSFYLFINNFNSIINI